MRRILVNKKTWKLASIPVVLIILLVATVGCIGRTGTSTPTTTTKTQTATIQKGNLSITVTSVGNLSFAQTQDLSFDTGGTVVSVPVSVGDYVTKGEVLAKLDESAWQDNITNLESQLAAQSEQLTGKQQQVTSAQRQVTAKQEAVTAAQQQVENANNAVVSAQRNVEQAQISLLNAQISQSQAYENLRIGKTEYDAQLYQIAQLQYTLAQEKLADAQKAVTAAQEGVTDSQNGIGDAQLAVQDAQTAVVTAQTSLTNAQNNLAIAQKNLDAAKATHTEITAPFDGIIISENSLLSNTSGSGNTVQKGLTVMTIADPNKFEADVLVGETDIPQVKVGQNCTIQLDAYSGMNITGVVTYISPTATIQQSVVNYNVKVQVNSPQSALPGTGTSTQGQLLPGFTPGQAPSGATPGQIPTTFPAGQLPSGFTPRQGQTGSAAAAALTIQLKQGMTATVNLIIAQHDNVLLVPNQAISRKSGTATVNVIKNGVTSSVTIKTGLSNYQYTEVTDGLSEGDQVVYTTTTTSSSSTNRPGGGGGPVFFP